MWRSAPVDATVSDFFNAVAALHTMLAPLDLPDALRAIEQRFGRERPHLNAPRTLDLDLLLYATLQLNDPRLHQRASVLQPLLEPGARPLEVLATHLQATAGQRVQRLTG